MWPKGSGKTIPAQPFPEVLIQADPSLSAVLDNTNKWSMMQTRDDDGDTTAADTNTESQAKEVENAVKTSARTPQVRV